MAFTSVNNIFHYLFKPEYISYETLVRLLVFVAGAILLDGFGALGIAAAYCVAGFVGYAFSFALLSREFRRIGLGLHPHVWTSFGFLKAL